MTACCVVLCCVVERNVTGSCDMKCFKVSFLKIYLHLHVDEYCEHVPPPTKMSNLHKTWQEILGTGNNLKRLKLSPFRMQNIKIA
jgi:hypothetical protein